MTYQELMETIAARVAALWPERTLYRDFCPVDFKRPSGFLYVTQADRADANLGLVRWDFAAELTCCSMALEEDTDQNERENNSAYQI